MKALDSKDLLSRTRELVAEERRATVALVEHLAEIQRRMLYAELGYASLWEFATRELGLSEGAAQRRIQAMRLLHDVPEAKEALEEGTLSLSNAAKLQSFRQNEKKRGRATDAKALIDKVKSLSQRECEQVLFAISPESLPQEREKVVSAQGERELRLVVSAELHEKLQRLRGLLAHKLGDATYAELLEHLAEECLERLEKKKGIQTTAAAAAESTQPIKPLPVGVRVALPQAIQRAVWARGRGQCEIHHEGRRCTSRYRLEIDHIEPLALGGPNTLENLRLACVNHNRQQALTKLGPLGRAASLTA